MEFVDGFFEMYKIGGEIATAGAELMAESAVSSYNHKFGTLIFGNHIDYRSIWIESLIESKRMELDSRQKNGSITHCLRFFDSSTCNFEMHSRKQI